MTAIVIIFLVLIVIMVVSNSSNTNSRPASSNSQPSINNSNTQRTNEYLRIETELKDLEKEKDEWEEEYLKFSKIREEAGLLEKEGSFNAAIEMYLKSIAYGEQSPKLKIDNYAHNIKRVIILYGKTKQKEKLREFLERYISLYPKYSEAKDWKIRLAKLDNKELKPIVSRTEIRWPKAINPTIGDRYREMINQMPDFNFYFDLPEGMDTGHYCMLRNPIPDENLESYHKIKAEFNKIFDVAKLAESKANYKLAIQKYEKLVIEDYPDKRPYERLMIIYRKFNWKEDEIRIIEKAISFFSDLRSKQLNHTLELAARYGMTDKAMEYINANEKIFYYMGAFELYNPWKEIKKWENRLKKMMVKV